MIDLQNKSYIKVVKSTAVFGSIKIVEMLVAVVRLKIVALILGPEGVGIQSLFQSTLASLNQFSSLGIFQSSVRNISQACESNDTRRISIIVKNVKRWAWFVGLLGCIVCLVFSKQLSIFVLNSAEHVWEFVLLSLGVLFWALSNGRIAIMQGCRQLHNLAYASLFGIILSLLLAIPFYIGFGYRGIVPAIVISYFSMYLVNSFFQLKKKEFNAPEIIPFRETIKEGRVVIKLGVVLMFSNFLMTLFSFFTNIFIRKYGNIEDIGLFHAAFTITYGNLLVFVTVLASDFFPRLSAVCNDSNEIKLIVNQQCEFFLLVIAPLTMLLVLGAPVFVNVLYSSKFTIIVPMLRWMSIALFFRIIWYSLSYIILAKGDKKTFFIYDALLGNGVNFIFNILAYYYWGLEGLGISFVVGAIFMAILLLCVTKVKYKFSYEKRFLILFFTFFVLTLVGCIVMNLSIGIYSIFCCCGIECFIILLSLKILNSRINLFSLLRNKFVRQK